MQTASYEQRRGQIEDYFDRTALKAWEQLTSAAPVGRIRATVRAGRERMRGQLLDWLPHDLQGARVLDAGCGTGALALEAAHRGAEVVAIDLSPSLVDVARQRGTELQAHKPVSGHIDWRSGDMLDPALGTFDHVVAMDSLIHYDAPDVVRALATLSVRCRGSMLFTFAPRTPMLAAMHAVGRMFPRGDRSPALSPLDETRLRTMLAADAAMTDWSAGRTLRVASGFYTSQALEWVKKP
jgi:magnesium-protoporphyrin O-methyltransferase